METAIQEFEETYQEWKPKMMKMASKTYIMDSAIDKEDVFQELAYTLWKCFNSYDPEEEVQFNTYYYTSAKNQVYMMLQYAGAKKRSGVKVSLELYNGHSFDNGINEALFKMALFQSIKDRQVQAAIEYVMEGGAVQDLPSDVVKQLKKAVNKTLRNRR